MKIVIVFPHGNIVTPKAGNESRVHQIAKQLSKENEILTLESKEYKNEVTGAFASKRYFFNPFILKTIHFGAFFTDFNPDYILQLYKIVKENNPEVIHVSYPQGLPTAKTLTNWNKKRHPIIIYDAHDIDAKRHSQVTLKEQDISIMKRGVMYLYGAIIERISCRLANHIIAVSDVDKDEFIRRYSIDRTKITVIPTGTTNPNLKSYNKIECREKLGLNEDKVIILFHGVYQYYPNREGIRRIKDYIAPNVYKRYKNVLFVIAGNGAPQYEDETMKSLGFIDDLNEVLVASDIAIVPILRGGGTRVKILDYMGSGLPIVTTKKGIEGIKAENDEHAIIVDGVSEEFINAIIYLIDNEEERKRIGANARRLAEEEYDWDKIGVKLDKLYRRILEEEWHVNKMTT